MSQEVIKRARELKEAYRLIVDSRRVLLVAHERPDADALGSMLSMYAFLRTQGIEGWPYCRDLPGKNLQLLPFASDIRNLIPDVSFDTILGFDYGDFKRLHIAEDIVDESGVFITFDHHVQGEPKGDLKIVYPNLSSTSELMYWFYKENGIPIKKDIALLMLTGIIADTGEFKHITTTPEVFRVVSDLLTTGVVSGKVVQSIRSERNKNQFPLWGRVLSRLIKHDVYNMAYSFVTMEDFHEFDAIYDDVSGVISLLNTASEAKFSLLLVENENEEIKGSLRSEQFKGVDVSQIASALGGGGHKYASGFSKTGTIESVLKDVENVLEQNTTSGVL